MEELKQRSLYPISVDCVVFGYADGELKVALIERKKPPFKGKWAIPGGFLEGDETVEEGAFRELKEETGIDDLYLQQFHVFSDVKRDPRGRVITVAFFALVDTNQYTLVASEDAAQSKWWPAHELPSLAFDHDQIYAMALNNLRATIQSKPIAFELLPKEFTLTELQRLYEEIFCIDIDKRNFRKKVSLMPYIRATGKETQGQKHRPAQLYQFNAKKCKEEFFEIF